jgi:acylpyruvate hydrolase
MKLVVYGPDRRLGALEGDQVIDLNFAYAKYLRETKDEPLPYQMASAIVPADLGSFIESGQRAIDGSQEAISYLTGKAAVQAGPRGERLVEPRAGLKLHAPYAQRARLIMGGGNYIVHSQGMGYRDAEGGRVELQKVYEESRKKGIWGFYCFTDNAIGPEEDIVYPARTDRLDYEGEVAVVLGKAGKDIPASKAADYYWGYMLQNDVSARTTIPERDNPQSTFNRPKNFDTSICGGPCIVVGELPDAQNITWETHVNGERRQTGNTKDMTFSFAEYVEYMSSDMTLRPGDVISAGTTAGTAQDSSEIMPGTGDGRMAKRDPKLFLKPGDVVEISNPLIGVLRNRVVAKP